ncbi:hypothetical protein N6H05_11235 [Sphingobium sp. WTD-1]|uniref:hypothetical protein n=1 Tax=Sphingobium sp. WTD-1 TaxID=2979467 RepID=UPI0024DE9292|nr:hypothetical protein [Sphingobium sp. WTD-1]WIA58334.1 hypothetical protein N6H05_11235 [Sphingobium sp. WTD-1]
MLKRRKPKVSLEDAMSLAKSYLSRQDLKGWRFEVAEAQRHPTDAANWSVIVDRFSPEGGLVDGPQILIVNGETGDVRTFEEFY